MTIKFNALLTQYESVQPTGKMLVALTPSGPQFMVKKFWFFRCIDRIFRGYSYDLNRCTKDLANRALTIISDAKKFEHSVEEHRIKQRTEERRDDLDQYAKKKLDEFTAELTAALKVIKIAQNLITHSFERRPEKKREGCSKPSPREEAKATVRSTAEAIAEYLGSKSNRTKVEMLLEYECYGELMQAVLQEGSLVNIPPEKLEPILQLACDQKREEVVITLLQHKVSSRHLSNPDPLFLGTMARELCRRDNDIVLSQLIEEQESISSDVELFLILLHKNLSISVGKFVEKGGELLKYTDDEKNTLLHAAFLTGNPILCRYLCLYFNPTARNLYNQTPLKAALDPKGLNASKCQLTPLNKKEFIERLTFREGREPSPLRAPNLSTLTHNLVSDDTAVDLIELFFLLGEKPTGVLSLIAKESFENTFSLLKNRYPKASFNDFYLSFFVVNKEYLKAKGEKLFLPKDAPENIPLQLLLTLFDSIPWTNTKIDTNGIYSLLFGKTEIPDNPHAELRALLETFVDRIENKKPFSDSSLDHERITALYQQIELFLRHTAALVARRKDPQLTLDFIIGVLRASRNNEDKCLHSIRNLYRQFLDNDEITPRIFFERLINGFRRACLKEVVDSIYGANSPIVELATSDLCDELGIAFWKQNSDSVQPSPSYDRDLIIKNFFEKAYTPFTIFNNCFLPLLQQDDEVRKMYLALQRELMPPTWMYAKYGRLLEEIDLIYGTKKQRTEQKNHVLARCGIERKQGERAKEAVERARKMEYINTYILDPHGDWNVMPLIELLEKLGILSFGTEKPSHHKQSSIFSRSTSLRNLVSLTKSFSPNISRKSKI